MSGAPIPPRDISYYGDPRNHGARCEICPLAGQTFVPAAPNEKKLRLVIVGEGPGRREVLRRVPFVGITGEMLNEELSDVNLDRETAWVSNATMCMPENDQDAARAAECCAPRLLQELAALPRAAPILTLGKAATRSVLGIKSILLARGFVWTARDLETSIGSAEAALRKAGRGSKKEAVVEAKLRLDTLRARHALAGRTVLPMLHPTFAFIHNEAWSPIFHIDLDRAARWIRGELTGEMLADRIERVGSIAELRRRKDVFLVTDSVDEIRKASKILGKEIGCDIETERLKPLSPLLARILCVQISDGDRSIVIGPWDQRIHARPLTEFLKGRVVVFHNGYNFDHPALERDGVSLDEVKLEDTLVAHHAFASQYPQKLDHVVATFTDSSPWKIRFGVRGAEEKGLAPLHSDAEELFLYGATDAVVTIKAWRAMQKDLEPERAVYEHDKLLGVQGKDMQVIGFRVDRKRRRLLSHGLKLRAASLKGRMRHLAHRPNFVPSRLGEVRRVLFGVLKAPMLNPTKTGLASTSNATLEQIRTQGVGTLRRGPADTMGASGPIKNETKQTRAGRFAEALLRWRVTEKVKSTYVDSVQIHSDGRAHYNWRPYGTNSGRFSCRLQSCPRWSTAIEDRPREMYVASPGCELVYFDLSQAEMRFAAALSGDPNFIETCKGDVHTGNARILFPDAHEMLDRDPKGKHCPRHGDHPLSGSGCNCGKPFRDVSKNCGFAVSYLAEAATVFAYLRAHGFPVELDDVEEMLNRLKSSYKRYYEYVAENVDFVEKNGYLRTAIMGRIRWFGFHPKPQEIANYPVQSGIADVMNTHLLELQKTLPREIELVAQIHDAAVFNTPRNLVELVKQSILDCWKTPVHLPVSVVCREARDMLLPAEIKVGHRWSEL